MKLFLQKIINDLLIINTLRKKNWLHFINNNYKSHLIHDLLYEESSISSYIKKKIIKNKIIKIFNYIR